MVNGQSMLFFVSLKCPVYINFGNRQQIYSDLVLVLTERPLQTQLQLLSDLLELIRDCCPSCRGLYLISKELNIYRNLSGGCLRRFLHRKPICTYNKKCQMHHPSYWPFSEINDFNNCFLQYCSHNVRASLQKPHWHNVGN